MRRRNVIIPIKGIRPPTNKTKEMRILSLVPRFEFQRIFLNQGLNNLELELLQFPRGRNDDLIDALASMDYIVHYPDKEKQWTTPPTPNHPDYEKWYIHNLRRKENGQDGE
jgi:phage terminase large subunit-like protein